MKNNKAFTLIELLAVIVILAIIALISTPIILGVIENAKKGASKNSVNGYMEAVELQIARNGLDSDDSNDIVDGTYTVAELTAKGVVVKGEQPTGSVVISKGQVDSGILVVEKYQYTITNGKIDGGSDIPENTIYKDSSGANYPEFTNTNLIPVNIDSNGIVTKANLEEKWYDYDTKEWANSIVPISSKVEELKNAAVNTIINEDDIEAYLVWIPRYKYAVPAGTGEREISVVFENGIPSKSGGDATGTNYLTHPAFTFGTDELKGIWVGKFELTGAITNPTIKPNIASLRRQTVSSFFNAMLAKMDAYKVDDSHMMKNMEWGAVAYLTQSKYGRCTNGTCTEVG